MEQQREKAIAEAEAEVKKAVAPFRLVLELSKLVHYKGRNTNKISFGAAKMIDGVLYVAAMRNAKYMHPFNILPNDILCAISKVYTLESNTTNKITVQQFNSRKFAPYVWRSVTQKDQLEPAMYEDGTLKSRSLTSTPMNKYLPEIKKAFAEKKDGKWQHHGTQRTMTVEIKYDAKNDELKAWFSSEYAGMPLGDYYMLINPSTAIFAEGDR
jgi:hypothetical protein